jgi:nucleoside-diphosphate-sugar epimerase
MSVYAAVRDAKRFAEFAALGVRLSALQADELPKGGVLIHSIPPLADPEKSAIRSLIREIAPRRILYISSTGVYGDHIDVNEHTHARPNDDKGHARIYEEAWLASLGPTLILRSAAIYGPGRGVHVRLREGKLPRGAGGVVSRIHVDDLAGILEAGIDSPLTGAWPVADENPAPSEEVAAWCADQMGLAVPEQPVNRFPVAGRSVDGRKIGELLGVKLKYPSYRAGIAASLLEESAVR